MKKLLLLSCLFITLLSCEDTKKASVKRQSKEKVNALNNNKNVDSIAVTSVEKKKPNEIKYPKITQENVVEFLTEYGKNNPETNVRISTIHGNIDIQLYKDTPLHRANFIYLVKQKYFDDTFFHRVDPDFIIQGGNSDDRSTSLKRRALSEKYRLPAELTTGRTHQYGTISGAKEYRKNPDKMTAPYEFFIFIGPKRSANHLNGDYTIFGKVTKGMDVVEIIANLPADKREWPLDNVRIKAEIME
ncbi:MAG: peptidylprolyl isomerase [Bacteroidetes bacterium]|nr:peptidylprolyl isomerase [Bacteroidota bacterium]